MSREYWLVHKHGYTEGWIYNHRDSAEKRLSSGLKAPPDADLYRITHVVEMKTDHKALTEKIEAALAREYAAGRLVKEKPADKPPFQAAIEAFLDGMKQCADKMPTVPHDWPAVNRPATNEFSLADVCKAQAVRIEELEAENARLREALGKIALNARS